MTSILRYYTPNSKSIRGFLYLAIAETETEYVLAVVEMCNGVSHRA